jgi:hypothetical protein
LLALAVFDQEAHIDKIMSIFTRIDLERLIPRLNMFWINGCWEPTYGRSSVSWKGGRFRDVLRYYFEKTPAHQYEGVPLED